jgi:hypothetical protein
LRRLCRSFFGRTLRFLARFRVRFVLQALAHLFRNFHGDRTGMRFLFNYAKSR